VRLLSRYLLRQLVGPFLFALAALTSLMLLSQIAKKFGALVGKGLPWSVIAEVFGLSIPFIVAMTLPMAVLLAVLYAFSHLAADNEITAMRASGISVYQVLVPVMAWGVFMSAFNFAFVDQILPRSNARLRNLLIDIGRKKPTFELREQVINEVPPSQYFLRANRIDAATGRLKEVTIYDVGSDASRRIIYADSGLMAYAEGQTDLSLRLFDGSIHQYRPSEPEGFQLTYFKVNDIRVRNVFDELERNTSESVRGDREMSTCEMLAVIHDADRERAETIRDRRELLLGDLRTLLALPAYVVRNNSLPDRPTPAYCRWIESLEHLVLPKPVEAQTPARSAGAEGRGGAALWQQGQDTVRRPKAAPPKPFAPRELPGQGKPPARVQQPGAVKAPAGGTPALPGQAPVPGRATVPGQRPVPGGARLQQEGTGLQSPRPRAPAPPRPTGPTLSNWSLTATAVDRGDDAARRADRFWVEVHKKWAISFACMSFVIIGIVMAVRFPRGGIGLVIGGGLLVFSVHYVGLTAGESLADRGLMSPWLAMWAPNIVLTILGLIGLVRLSRESGSTRGGDFQEVLDSIRHLFRRLRRRRRSHEAA
jgi:lipopolysaccharide export system permease protein